MNEELDDFLDQVGSGKSTQRGLNPSPGSAYPSDCMEKGLDYIDGVGSDSLSIMDVPGEARWSENDGKFWRSKRTHKLIPPGLYKCTMIDGIGAALVRQPLETDDLLILPEPTSQFIMGEFQKFWALETKEKFKKLGYIYKRGMLLWGPPAGGKTSILNLLMKEIINIHSGIIIVIDNPDWASKCLTMARQVEPDRPLITISEDIDTLIDRYGENEFLALLDGADQVANVVHIATTNYPERLDKRFVARTSRFDIIKKVGMPRTEAREAYFKFKLVEYDWFTSSVLDKWVNMSEGLSIADLKEMIISVCCLDKDIESTVERLKLMHSRKPKSDDEDELADRIGFGR